VHLDERDEGPGTKDYRIHEGHSVHVSDVEVC
jgi:hypothetical protein